MLIERQVMQTLNIQKQTMNGRYRMEGEEDALMSGKTSLE
jgi:hypothetical protein